MPVSGTLWKATRAGAEKGAAAWAEIVSRVTWAIAGEFGLQAGSPPSATNLVRDSMPVPQ